MDLSVREQGSRRAVLALCNGLGGGFYWEVRVTDLSEAGTTGHRLTSPYKFASPAQAASDGFKALNAFAQEGVPSSEAHQAIFAV